MTSGVPWFGVQAEDKAKFDEYAPRLQVACSPPKSTAPRATRSPLHRFTRVHATACSWPWPTWTAACRQKTLCQARWRRRRARRAQARRPPRPAWLQRTSAVTSTPQPSAPSACRPSSRSTGGKCCRVATSSTPRAAVAGSVARSAAPCAASRGGECWPSSRPTLPSALLTFTTHFS